MGETDRYQMRQTFGVSLLRGGFNFQNGDESNNLSIIVKMVCLLCMKITILIISNLEKLNVVNTKNKYDHLMLPRKMYFACCVISYNIFYQYI